MEKEPLKNEEILVSNIELKEITKKDGGTFKQFNVKVPSAEKGVWYSIPIKKKDGGFTSAYETYKESKDKLEEQFIEGNLVKFRVAFDEKVKQSSFKGKDGQEANRFNKYRTIRFFEILGTEKSEPVEEEIDVADIPF